MSEIYCADKMLDVDDDGYLVNIEEWDEDVAQALAAREGVENLSEEKMAILRFMRDYYKKFKAFPILNYVCKNIHQPKECVNEQFINPEKAWKIAGLAKPEGLHFITMDGEHYIMEECC